LFDEDINEGVERLDRLIKASQCSKGPDSSSLLSSVRNALDNDLDTWSARESLDLFAKETLEGVEEDSNAASTLSEAAALLGVLI
jgi:cysteinyl-tRNA synthetase